MQNRIQMPSNVIHNTAVAKGVNQRTPGNDAAEGAAHAMHIAAKTARRKPACLATRKGTSVTSHSRRLPSITSTLHPRRLAPCRNHHPQGQHKKGNLKEVFSTALLVLYRRQALGLSPSPATHWLFQGWRPLARPCETRPRKKRGGAQHSELGHLGKEGRLHSQVARYHVEAEEVPVDARTCHGQAVHMLVLLSSHLEQLQAL